MIEMIKFADEMPEIDEVIIVASLKNISDAAFFKVCMDDDDDYYLTNIHTEEDVSIDGSAYWGYVPEFEYPEEPELAPAPAPTNVSGYKIVNGMVVKA